MKYVSSIAFDVRELSGRPAGVGRIISSLINAMREIAPDIRLILIGDSPAAPAVVQGEYIGIRSSGLAWHIKCAKILKNNPQWKAYVSVRSPLVPIVAPERSIYFVNDLISFRNPEFFTLKTRLIEIVFTRLALRRVQKLVAISRATAQDVERICPGAGKRTTVVYLAADPLFQPGPPDVEIIKKHGLPAKYILTVGTIEPRKNHLALIEAYRALPGKLKSKYGLVVVGKRGWKCDKIMQTINRMETVANFRYLDYISDADLAQVYRGASLFVYPSIYEGFGLPVLEAMSCGVPTITSNCSSLPEVGGSAAGYFNPLNTAEISNKMEEVLDDPKMAVVMNQKGMAQSRIFSWGKSARDLLKLASS